MASLVVKRFIMETKTTNFALHKILFLNECNKNFMSAKILRFDNYMIRIPMVEIDNWIKKDITN